MKSEKSERRKKLRSVIKMVRYPVCLVCMMVVLTSCLSFKEKEEPLKIDYDKCQEVVIQYMKEKYKEDFEYIRMKRENSSLYYNNECTEVMMELEKGKNKDYYATIYVDEYNDADGDGYCDSYKVVSDTYMRELVQEAAREEMEEMLQQSGLQDYWINILYISELSGIEEFNGFSLDVMIPDENFSLEEMMKSYPLDIYCSLSVEESVYQEQVKKDMIRYFKPKLVDGTMWIELNIYPEQNQEEEYLRTEQENRFVGKIIKDKIKFSITE